MLDVIFFYPFAQGRSGGERTFNREVDICKYTWEENTHRLSATASPPPDSNHATEKKTKNLSLLTVQPVLREEVK